MFQREQHLFNVPEVKELMRATISVEDKTSRIQHVEGGYTFPPFVVMHRGETIKHLAQQEDATRTVIISVRLPASPALPCPAVRA